MTSAESSAKRQGVKLVKLKLVRVDVWSAIKFGFLLQVGLGIATIILFFLLWLAASQSGLFGSVSGFLTTLIGNDTSSVDVGSQISLPRVLGLGGGLAVFNIIVGTLSTFVGALIFNSIGKVVGGISVGFSNN
ncbi:MAG: hypothetical protein RLZ28_489 [Actinomycetota bacterium]|jgi:hypothetical protein